MKEMKGRRKVRNLEKQEKAPPMTVALNQVSNLSHMQSSPFIMLCLGSIGIDCVNLVNHVIKGQFNKIIIGTIK